jgi:hypothetical protein
LRNSVGQIGPSLFCFAFDLLQRAVLGLWHSANPLPN